MQAGSTSVDEMPRPLLHGTTAQWPSIASARQPLSTQDAGRSKATQLRPEAQRAAHMCSIAQGWPCGLQDRPAEFTSSFVVGTWGQMGESWQTSQSQRANRAECEFLCAMHR